MTGGPNWYTSERKRRGRDRRSARQANTAAPLCVFVFFCSTLTDSHRKAVSFNGHGVFTRPCRPGPGLMANGPAAGCPSRPPFFPSRRTHPWHYPVPHTPPHSPLDNCSDSNGLKMTLFSHFLFFFFLLVLLSLPPLLFSFHAGWKASQTPTLCAYHSGQDTQEVYVLCRGESGGRGRGGGGSRGGEWVQKKKKEGLNASHVKLMRTNPERWNLVFSPSLLLLFVVCQPSSSWPHIRFILAGKSGFSFKKNLRHLKIFTFLLPLKLNEWRKIDSNVPLFFIVLLLFLDLFVFSPFFCFANSTLLPTD